MGTYDDDLNRLQYSGKIFKLNPTKTFGIIQIIRKLTNHSTTAQYIRYYTDENTRYSTKRKGSWQRCQQY